MADDSSQPETDLEPIFVSVKEAARLLNISTWQVYALLDQQVMESRYIGRRRLIVLESLREYAANLSKYPAP